MRSSRSLVAVAVAATTLFGVGSAVAADTHDWASDVCLEIVADTLPPDAWDSIIVAVEDAVAARPDLFPAPSMIRVVSGLADRVDISATGGAEPGIAAEPDCLQAGSEWSAWVGREFLDLGADRMLAQAPTTPGIASSVDVQWFPDEGRLTTTLHFEGPLSVPNGTCWIDDTLGVDAATGSAVASVEQGVKTSLFAEGACGRFFDFLVHGGAGEQAITLLPTSVDLADGATLRFETTSVAVREDGVVLGGTIEIK